MTPSGGANVHATHEVGSRLTGARAEQCGELPPGADAAALARRAGPGFV